MNNPSKIIILKDHVIVNNKLVKKCPVSAEKFVVEENVNKLGTKVKATNIELASNKEMSLVFEEETGEGEGLQAEVNLNKENQEAVWDDTATVLLLNEYENYLQEFRNSKTKKKVLWDKIAKSFRERGYANVNGIYLDQKFRNLKNTYKKIKDNNKKSATGRGRVYWKYYDRFEKIFASGKTINTPTLISTTVTDATLGPPNIDTCSTTPTSSGRSTPECTTFTRLDNFRKRQLTLEEARLDELKAIRLEIAESNRISQEKLLLLKHYFSANNKDTQ